MNAHACSERERRHSPRTAHVHDVCQVDVESHGFQPSSPEHLGYFCLPREELYEVHDVLTHVGAQMIMHGMACTSPVLRLVV
jgi:hypothetical protein